MFIYPINIILYLSLMNLIHMIHDVLYIFTEKRRQPKLQPVPSHDDNMPMEFHSRHGAPRSSVTMDDGQIAQKIAQSQLEITRATNQDAMATTHKSDKTLVNLPGGGRIDLEMKVEDPSNQGLLSPTALLTLFLWYFFSAITLFLNKYLLVTLNVDAIMLGE